MSENITRNEVLNDGRTIHLYFNGMIGLYVAYGISAFLLTKYAKAKSSYSEDMQMPVAVINAEHYEELKRLLGLSKDIKNYRCLEVAETYNENEYDEWASQLRVEGQN